MNQFRCPLFGPMQYLKDLAGNDLTRCSLFGPMKYLKDLADFVCKKYPLFGLIKYFPFKYKMQKIIKNKKKLIYIQHCACLYNRSESKPFRYKVRPPLREADLDRNSS